MLPLLFSLFMIDTNTPTLERTLEAIPEDSDYFLSVPMDLTIDDAGRIYVADAEAKTIFVWNKDGSYVGNFGKEGSGPGEFSFMSMGPQAYVGVVGDEIYIYDGGRRMINVFGTDWSFKRAEAFQMTGGRGRVEYFTVTPDKQFVILTQTFGETRARSVGIYKQDGSLITNVAQVEDNTYKMQMSGGRPSGMTMTAYAARPTTHLDTVNKEIIFGDPSTPSFTIHDMEGNLVTTVKLPMSQQEVDQDDKDEYNQIEWIKRSNWVKVDFPDKKAFYTHILPLADKTYLVYSLSPFYNNIEGLHVDRNGKAISRVTYAAGENGNLFSAQGRIYAVSADDYGDFGIHQLNMD